MGKDTYPDGDDSLFPGDWGQTIYEPKVSNDNIVIRNMVGSNYNVKSYDQGDGTSVNTKGIEDFKNQLSEYIEVLDDLMADMGPTSAVAPGAFPSAVRLGQTVSDTHTSLYAAINNLRETFYDLQGTMSQISSRYATLEEASAMTATKFGELMAEVNAGIGAAGTE